MVTMKRDVLSSRELSLVDVPLEGWTVESKGGRRIGRVVMWGSRVMSEGRTDNPE